MFTFNRFHVAVILLIVLFRLENVRHTQAYFFPFSRPSLYRPLSKIASTTLFGGIGIAKDYSWKEEQFEIELKIPIPLETKQSDVIFKAKLQSIQLSLRTKDGVVDLVEGHREMRGRIDMDGTFWSFSDYENHGADLKSNNQKFIVITIEKMITPTSEQFDIIEYDWGGIYRDDDTEVISKKYAEPEVLNIREYAASLYVDIDNIDMSKVDKNMFTSGLNMTRSSLDELCKMGYVKEVTRQNDGNEFVEDENSGESIPFNFLGNGVGLDEIKNVADQTTDFSQISTQTLGASKNPSKSQTINDPIDLLSADRLREILNAEGITTGEGAKVNELRTTLKEHIQVKLSKRKV